MARPASAKLKTLLPMQPASKICYAAAEVAPFAKTGGLGDVAASLPRQLLGLGHDVRVFTPLHSTVNTRRYEFHPVRFIQDVEIALGRRHHRFTAYTARAPGSELWLYFIDCPELFHRAQIYTDGPDEARRFALFCRATIECCQRMGFAPDVFHCNDWHTALMPMLLRSSYGWDSMFRASKTLLTVHNVGYQGIYPSDLVADLGLGPWSHLLDQDELRAGRVNLLRTGLLHADMLSTVSPTHAEEIQTPEFGMGLDGLLRARRDRLVGILNGVDYDEWDPEKDRFIPHHYSRRNLEGKKQDKLHLLQQLHLPGTLEAPLLGVVSRLVHQKGFDLCFDVLPRALAQSDLTLAVLGSGEQRYEEYFERLQRAFPRQVAFYRGYSHELAHLIEAGADMLLMPSRYEPCGLNQMFSLRYGTLPIVRRTGGLADSVEPFNSFNGKGTGFVFEHFTADGLQWALSYALATYRDRKTWRRLMERAMEQDFSWETQAKRYAELYAWLAQN